MPDGGEPTSWTPKATKGLWGIVQRAVSSGMRLADVREAVARAGQRPDVATLSHLYARAVEAESVRRAEADYRSRVDPDTYAARRPAGTMIARMPQGFKLAARYRQVVAVTGTDIRGQTITVQVNVSTDRLLSRGEAIDQAMAAVGRGSPAALLEVDSVEYDSTWTEE